MAEMRLSDSKMIFFPRIACFKGVTNVLKIAVFVYSVIRNTCMHQSESHRLISQVSNATHLEQRNVNSINYHAYYWELR